MRYCDTCDIEFANPTCPRCGGRPSKPERHHPEKVRHSTFVSDPPEKIDTMIEEASRPSLATLLKRGLEKGLIKPLHDYAQGKRT